MHRQKMYKLRAKSHNTTIIKWKAFDAHKIASKSPTFLARLLKDFISKFSNFYKAFEWLSSQIEYPRDSTILW